MSEKDFLPSSVTDRPVPPNSKQATSGINSFSIPEASTDEFISPEVIRSYPKAAPRKQTCRGRKKGKSMIATDSPEKKELEEKYLRKQVKQRKGPNRQNVQLDYDKEGRRMAIRWFF